MAPNSEEWIERTLQNASKVIPEIPDELELAGLLVDTCIANRELSPARLGLLYASAFDLLVAAKYYSALSHSGWLYCPTLEPRLFFHYTNCCPRDVLSGAFHFNVSNKPQSGRIGTATSRLLLIFFQILLKKAGRPEEVLKGAEPVDAVVVDRKQKKILFAEIKASPLVTPAISLISQKLTVEVNAAAEPRPHSSTDNANLFGNDLEIHVPQKNETGNWIDSYFKIGQRANATDRAWAHRGLINLLRTDPTFFPIYFQFWKEALNTYYPKNPTTIFWLTNASGSPTPVPENWPQRRVGEGYESISDSKTSVGMDRTDDIKKGIYQVLKLGSEGKPHAGVWDYKVGLLSNIHAARHFDEYLESIKDIIWTIDATGKAKRISDLAADLPVYNLFDGLIAFTRTISRDEWISSVFSAIS